MFIVWAVILTITVQGQDGTPVITPENIAQLTELEVIGRGVIYNAIYSPDGNLIAVAGSRGVWLYDAQDLDAEPRLLNGHRGPTTTIAFSPDSRLLASGSTDEFVIDPDIHLWDVATGEKVATLTGHTDGVGALAFHPSGEWLVSSSWEFDETVRVWKLDGNTAEQVAVVPSPDHDDEHAPDNGATDMEFDASGEHLAIAFWDSRKGISDYFGTVETIAFDDLLAGLANFQIVEITTGIFPLFVSYHPTLSKFAYTGFFRMGIWDSAQNSKLFYGTPNDKRGICDVAYDPTGQFLALGSSDGRIIFWDTDTHEAKFSILWDDSIDPNRENIFFPCRIAFSPDGLRLLVINRDNIIQLFDVQTRQKIHTIDFNPPIQQIAFQDNDSMLAVFKKPNRNLDFAQVDLSQTTLIDYPLPYELQNITLSNDGRYFAFLVKEDEETFVYIHDIVEHQTRYFLTKSNMTTNILYLDGEKNLLYLANYISSEKFVYEILDIQENVLIASFEYLSTYYLHLSALAPTDNPFIAYATEDGDGSRGLFRVDYVKGEIEKLRWGLLNVEQIFINEGLEIVITIDRYYSEWRSAWREELSYIELMDLYSGEVLRRLTGHILSPTSVSFSYDKSLLASGSYDGTVRIWDIQTGEQVALLDTHTDSITQVLFNHDGTRLATASEDGTIRVWGIAP
ncbi:MAG: hypothetical protein KJ043_01140 [Anaerolineae bacterium]|nr:hypothetical protein [Anaerolineae bacterium]